MKKNGKAKWTAVLLSAAIFLLPLTSMNNGSEKKEDNSSWFPTLYAMEDRTEELQAEINQAKDKLEQTKNEIDSIQKQSAEIKEKISAMKMENEKLEAEKKKIEEQVAEAEKTLLLRMQEQKRAEEDVLRKHEEYQRRVSAMFYFRKRSPWEILLSSRGISGFFTNLRMIEAIASSDAESLKELKQAEDVKRAATELASKTKDEFDRFLSQKLEEMAQLQAGISDAEQKQNELFELLNNRSMELHDEEAEVREKEAAFQAYQAAAKKYAGQIAKLTPAGHGAVWPLPASQTVTSPYGYRTLSFDKGNGYLHTGTDFSGPGVAGTPVVAAWEGVVMTVHQPYPGQMYAPDANYVQINHGGGLGTGYWHLLSVCVVPGQHVAQGQVIGYCGSTGMSTGPHLHFEVYDEKSTNLRHTVDPMLYLGG